VIKWLALVGLDVLDSVLGHRDDLTPPRRLMFDGPRNPREFRQSGEGTLRVYRELCGLEPHHRVLDVGCGIGRKTVPLLSYLSDEGTYFGFDIVPEGIAWCNEHIAARRANFRFEHVDVFNARYNPTGRIKALEFRFPCPDQSFDLVSVASVFTHMRIHDIGHYLEEIRRALAPGGRCLCSFFLLNDDTRESIRRHRAALRFASEIEGGLTTSPRTPEDATAYDEHLVHSLIQDAGLRVREPILYGSWSGRLDSVGFQDLVVVERAW
jgi:SAM-dependent methyltransferase